MHRLIIVLFATLFTVGWVSGQDKQTTGDPSEIVVLKRFLGTWDVIVTNRPAAGEPITYKAVSRRTWDDIGNSVRFEDEQPNNRPPLHMTLRYDSEVGNYPMEVEAGERGFQLIGSWNEKTATMDFVGNLPNGSELSLSHNFSAKDKAIVSATVKNAEGTAIAKLEFHQTRRKGEE